MTKTKVIAESVAEPAAGYVRVVLISSIAGEGFSHSPGDVLNVPQVTRDRMIEHGLARDFKAEFATFGTLEE